MPAHGKVQVGFNTSFSDANTGIFGGDSAKDTSGTKTETINIDKEGLLKMIDDALRGTSGLAEIFGKQAGAGLFGGSVAKSGTEDLIAKIAGELAKVTGTRITANEATATTEVPGLLDNVVGSNSIIGKGYTKVENKFKDVFGL